MSEDIDDLRARSDELDPDDLRGAAVVYEAILRLEEGDVLATRGLALALVKMGELDRAEEIVQEALVLHPGDKVLQARESDIASARRWAAKEAAAGTTKKTSAATRPASTWIKAVHYYGGRLAGQPGDEMWLSDPGQRDGRGQRLYTAAGEPWGRPSWRVGEQAGVYLGGIGRVPIVVEIVAPPEFNPEFVQAAEWAKDEDGERWPWVTWFRVLKAVEVDEAPTLDQLGIATISMQRRARLRTDPEIHGRLVQALDALS
jgi:tetratricopeptide (TPR) repeat protein